MKRKHVGNVIVEVLEQHGVPRVFAVPGESYLALLDGLHDSEIETVVCRHEGGASYMAEAHGKLTGAPGVAMVTRGPGAANAYVGLHTAWQDGTPLVLFVGLVPIADRDREAFQEFDPKSWFADQTKRVYVLDDPARTSEVVAEAFFVARAGRPGPVVVGLPEDVIARNTDPAGVEPAPPLPVAEGAVSDTDLEVVTDALLRAERPLILAGGPRWTTQASADLTVFAERHGVPVIQEWRASDRVPFRSPVYCGQTGYGRSQTTIDMLARADLLLCIGTVPGDVQTDGFSVRQSPRAANIVVSADAELLGRSGGVTHHVLASPAAFGAAVRGFEVGGHPDWSAWLHNGRTAQVEFSTVPQSAPGSQSFVGTVRLAEVFSQLLARIPEDAIHTFGAGNHCIWAQRFLPTNVYPSELSTRNGSMGYSIPSAVAASLEFPDRTVVTVAGDGEFLMNGQELATAVQFGAAMLIIVVDNGQYGTIHTHQEREYPGRVVGTQLQNPDLAAYARSYGAFGEKITDDAQAGDAVARALDHVVTRRRPALLHAVTGPDLAVPE